MIRIVLVLALAVFAARCAQPIATLPVVESVCSPEFEYKVYKNGEAFNLRLEIGPFTGPYNCLHSRMAVRRNPTIIRISTKSLDEAHKLIEKETQKTQAHNRP